MSKFNYAEFGVDGSRECFVVNATKYTDEEAIALFEKEAEWLFYGLNYIKPTVDDVVDCFCAFRFGVDGCDEGCYTIVDKKERGSFPVWVINYDDLKTKVKVR